MTNIARLRIQCACELELWEKWPMSTLQPFENVLLSVCFSLCLSLVSAMQCNVLNVKWECGWPTSRLRVVTRVDCAWVQFDSAKVVFSGRVEREVHYDSDGGGACDHSEQKARSVALRLPLAGLNGGTHDGRRLGYSRGLRWIRTISC